LVSTLIGASMAFSLPWALPIHNVSWKFEREGFFGLLAAMAACFIVAGILRHIGRDTADDRLFRKEALAVVGLSWLLATVLGALPYYFSATECRPDVPMSFVDSMFESQSGFSTTGATVLTNLEDHEMVPRCILFWRSSTHFLGGLGIIVLFVAILGQGSAGKALMRAEMPGPSKSTPQARMQQSAWILFFVYTGLNALLTIILMLENLSLFDSLCHAFGTMATGGFSTYNLSVGHFTTQPQLYNGPLIEMTITVFMVLAGTNFMLIYWSSVLQWRRLIADIEWRTYLTVIALATIAIIGFGLATGDFSSNNHGMESAGTADPPADGYQVGKAVRYTLFQVVSIITTTGFCTDNFDIWSSFSRGLLILLMFVGGCAGSTGGGMKVIRHILFFKILRQETERAFHPTIVRPLRLGGKPIEDPDLRMNILVYFGLVIAIFALSWLAVLTLEPNSTWTDNGHSSEHKLIDAASSVTATLNNIGPGLGVVGATKNYTNFTDPSKLLFTWLMMLGRLELFAIIVLFIPSYWRRK